MKAVSVIAIYFAHWQLLHAKYFTETSSPCGRAYSECYVISGHFYPWHNFQAQEEKFNEMVKSSQQEYDFNKDWRECNKSKVA